MGSDPSAYRRHRPVRFGEISCGWWATATSNRSPRDPGQHGVRLHGYLDVRQERNTPCRRLHGAGEAPSRRRVCGSAGCGRCQDGVPARGHRVVQPLTSSVSPSRDSRMRAAAVRDGRPGSG
ncbi:DUF6207 family protein [Streptomyces iakyrus]|uniref:DUF6207 family protein n=1 Tax=Streptomyces iakyrus TaxID=68219 RepID=UPI0033C19908